MKKPVTTECEMKQKKHLKNIMNTKAVKDKWLVFLMITIIII